MRAICMNCETPVWPISGCAIAIARRVEARAVLVHRAPLLAQRDRHARRRGDAAPALRCPRARTAPRRNTDGTAPARSISAIASAGGEFPVQVDHQLRVRPERFAQRAHLGVDAVVRDGRGVLERVEAARRELVARARPCSASVAPGRPDTYAGIASVRWPPSSFDDGLADELAEQVPQRDVDAGDRVDVVAAEEAAHAHQVVEILLDHDDVARIAARSPEARARRR